MENAKPKRYEINNSTGVQAKVRYTSKSGKTRAYYRVAQSRDGTRLRLTVLSGSFDFWVDADAVEVVKSYGKTMTLGKIRDFVARVKKGEQQCAECGGFGELIEDMEDGMLKHRRCCDIPS